jgi:hypothetical protein
MNSFRSVHGSPPRWVPSARPRYRPKFDCLEKRCLLATTIVSLLTDTTEDSSPGELRSAVNNSFDGDMIVFQPGLSGTIQLDAGLGPMSIRLGLTIDGTGASVAVSGQKAIRIFVIEVGGNATLTGLTIRDGFATEGGGGIFNSGTLTVQSSTLSGNTAGFGGAIYNHNGATLMVQNSTLSGNEALGAGLNAGLGGGICNQGDLTVQHSTLSGNTTIFGGGIYNGGDAFVQHSTLSGNMASYGGGIYNHSGSYVQVLNSTLSGNMAEQLLSKGDGGGIYNSGRVRVQNSTLSGNMANRQGGGISNRADLEVYDSTLSGNMGVYTDDPTFGGAIYNRSGGSVTIQSSTLSGNSALQGPLAGGFGGGISNDGSFFPVNTIIAGNSATNGGPDIQGAVNSRGYNLVGNGAGSSGITNGINFDQVGTGASPINPLLGPLQNNGGPTLTMLLLPGSPARGKGSQPSVSTDQRGVPYPPNGPWDIGAVQVSIRSFRAVGAAAGGLPEVKMFDAQTGALVFDFLAYRPSFRGGVRVAVGDVNGDSVADLITGAGPGGRAHVKVFDGNNRALLSSFRAYVAPLRGGVFVAAGDIDGDRQAEVITGAGRGGAAHVKVFDGLSAAVVQNYRAFGPTFRGGVRVAAGDLDGDNRDDVIASAGPGGVPHVKVFSGVTGATLRSFLAYAAPFRRGVFVAAGDVNRDGFSDIITGAGAGGLPHVKVFDGRTGATLQSFLAVFDVNPATFRTSGVRVGAGDFNGDGRDDLLLGAGPGQRPRLQALDALSLATLDDFFAYHPTFRGGVFVAA